jgi:hypothetical protein
MTRYYICFRDTKTTSKMSISYFICAVGAKYRHTQTTQFRGPTFIIFGITVLNYRKTINFRLTHLFCDKIYLRQTYRCVIPGFRRSSNEIFTLL